MDQQVGAEQETRNVAAPLEDLHLIGHAQRLGLQLERTRIILADGDQAGTLFKLVRQRGQGLEAAVQPLGLEAGADLHQQQVVVRQFEFTTELGADLGRVGRCAAILGNARRQQMKALARRLVVLDEQRLLHLGDHQDLGLRLRGKHRPLVVGKVFVAAPALVDGRAQGLRLVLVAAVGGVVDVEARHLVEAHHPVHRIAGQVRRQPGAELLVAVMVEERLDRRHPHIEAGGHLALPDRRIDADGMTARLTLQGDAHEVALQPTEGEILVEHEGQLHQRVSRLASRRSSSGATRAASSPSKQGLSRSPPPASGPVAHR